MKSGIVTAGLILGLLLFSTVGIASALSNSGCGEWGNYFNVLVKENSGETLVNYQVLVNLSGSNFPEGVQPDGDDIRFTSDSAELSYWIEEFDYAGKHARIWVKVPLIPANGQTILKMYYGNPSASAVSDGDATFEFFDDFEDYTGDIDGQGGWSVITGGSSTAKVTDGILDLNRDGSNDVQVNHSIILPDIFLYRVRVKPENFNSNKRWFLWDGVDYSTHVSFWFERSDYASAQRSVAGQCLVVQRLGIPTYGVWHINDLIIDTTGSTVAYKYYEDDNLITDALATTKDWPGTSNILWYGIEGYDGVGHCYFDYTYVCKYASTEPTVTLSRPAPAVTTFGIIALVGLLGILTMSTIVKRKKG